MNEEERPPIPRKLEGWVTHALDTRTLNPLFRKPKWSPYPRFNDRMTAFLIDCAWILVLLSPLITRLHQAIFGNDDYAGLAGAPNLSGLFEQMAASGLLQRNLAEYAGTYAVTAIFIITCWSYASATPGKWLLRQRIVRDGDLGRPTMKQWWLRYLGFLLVIPGLFWIFFDPKRRALHDLIAGTLVVKVRHWRLSDRERPFVTADDFIDPNPR